MTPESERPMLREDLLRHMEVDEKRQKEKAKDGRNKT